jgi:CHRD domain
MRRFHAVRKALAVVVTLGVSLVVGTGVSSAGEAATAKTYQLRASMTPGQVVTPRNRDWRVPASLAGARGSFTATFDQQRRTLAWKINYTGLANQPLVIADIHVGKPGRFGPILVRLCSECKPGQKGVKRLTKVKAQILTTGDTWVTLITGKYPNGALRGQIKVA